MAVFQAPLAKDNIHPGVFLFQLRYLRSIIKLFRQQTRKLLGPGVTILVVPDPLTQSFFEIVDPAKILKILTDEFLKAFFGYYHVIDFFLLLPIFVINHIFFYAS